jgi:hypothetical protein
MASSLELNELATALAAAQAEFTAIPKDSSNPFFKSRVRRPADRGGCRISDLEQARAERVAVPLAC